jgi:hypothetical protein
MAVKNNLKVEISMSEMDRNASCLFGGKKRTFDGHSFKIGMQAETPSQKITSAEQTRTILNAK